MKDHDDLIVETLCQGLQAAFEALNQLGAQLSAKQQEDLSPKTRRIAAARTYVLTMLEERRG